MAVLTSTGITFSDGTSLSSKYGIVPQNAVSVFFQSGAPTGWARLPAASDHNNKTLRVVSGTGGGSGGSTAFTSVFPNSTIPFSFSATTSGTIGGHTLGQSELPNHTHVNNGAVGLTPQGASNVAAVFPGPGWTRTSPDTGTMSPSASGGSHTHPFSGSASFSTSLDLRVQYIDVILCQFS